MKSWIFIGLLLAMMSGAAMLYYNTTQKRVQQLLEENSVLESNVETLVAANDANIQALDELQVSYDSVVQNYQELETRFQQIRSQNRELQDRLSKHELDALAAAKPVLVETIINNASAAASRCFELLSGASLTEEELNAETPNQFNSECPWLFDSLTSR